MKSILSLVALLLFVHTTFSDEPPAEMSAFKRYSGTWDVAIEGDDGGKGTTVTSLALDGRFMRQEWSYKSGDGTQITGMAMATFDTDKGTYRAWHFYSNGLTSESTGKWDEANRTFAWSSQDPKTGNAIVTKSTFTADDIEKWTVTSTDGSGNVAFEIKGTSTRRK